MNRLAALAIFIALPAQAGERQTIRIGLDVTKERAVRWVYIDRFDLETGELISSDRFAQQNVLIFPMNDDGPIPPDPDDEWCKAIQDALDGLDDQALNLHRAWLAKGYREVATLIPRMKDRQQITDALIVVGKEVLRDDYELWAPVRAAITDATVILFEGISDPMSSAEKRQAQAAVNAIADCLDVAGAIQAAMSEADQKELNERWESILLPLILRLIEWIINRGAQVEGDALGDEPPPFEPADKRAAWMPRDRADWLQAVGTGVFSVGYIRRRRRHVA